MEGVYEVWLTDKIAGEVLISREGLYYRFLCSVRIPKGSHYHLVANSGGGNIDLGLCIPQGDSFVRSTKIPVKRFGSSNYRYILSEKGEKQVIPISGSKPFAHLNKLTAGYFSIENNVPVIIIPKKGSNGA